MPASFYSEVRSASLFLNSLTLDRRKDKGKNTEGAKRERERGRENTKDSGLSMCDAILGYFKRDNEPQRLLPGLTGFWE